VENATCERCGQRLPPSARFCGHCGAKQTATLPAVSDNPLDRWIVARINEVAARCTVALRDSDAYAATMAVEALMDDLTNWYVRRSRRRFWKSEHDTDKNTAYATLYYVMVRLIKLLAPFTPFVSEVMYQNLVRAVQPEAYESVHHCAWPEVDEAAINATLLEQMALARRVASLGLGARGSANIKVRQPLAKVVAHVQEGVAELADELVAIVADEVNVKELTFAADESDIVSYRLVADGRQLGPKFGREFGQVRAALAQADPVATVKRIRAELPVELAIDDRVVEIAPEEIIVNAEPPEGLAVASDRGITVAIDTVITPALRAEGLVRDIVRQVQTLRKEADYALDDRITVGLFDLDEALRADVAAFQTYLCDETLATAVLNEDDGAAWDQHKAVKVGGATIEVAVRR